MRPILRAVLATKIGQVPAVSYIKRVKNIQAKSHVSKWLLGVIVKIPNRDEIISWSEKTALFRFAPLVSQPSLSSTYCPNTPLPHLCIHSDILCHQTNKVPPWSWMCVVPAGLTSPLELVSAVVSRVSVPPVWRSWACAVMFFDDPCQLNYHGITLFTVIYSHQCMLVFMKVIDHQFLP